MAFSKSSKPNSFIQDILKEYRCPHDCQNHAYVTIGCPFGHCCHKKDLPTYVCVNYLLNKCKKKMTKDDFLFCEDGFHLSGNDLLDLDLFNKRMASWILEEKPLENKPEFKLTGTSMLECCICFSPFDDVYGQLSDCTHVFCTKCITDWFKKERSCPICRKKSRFILPWHGLIASNEEKTIIAKMQAEMAKVSDLNDNLAESEMSNGLVELSLDPVTPHEQIQVNNVNGNNFSGNNSRGNNNNRGNGRGNNRGNYRGNYRGSYTRGGNRGGYFNSYQHNY